VKQNRGFMVITDPSARQFTCEIETFTCCHCQQIVDRMPGVVITSDAPDGRRAVGAWCTCCDAPMCLRCVGKGCRPIERWLERMETRRNYDEAMRGD